MRSTFYGFEAAKKALNANQIGIDVAGQNIANVNTKGYTRQRVDLASIPRDSGTSKYTDVSKHAGMGVEVTGISQIRSKFLDIRYRSENAKHSTWSSKLDVLRDIENVFDETVNYGLNATLADFYKQLQNLSGNAGDIEFANIVRSSAQTITEVLNQYAQQLQNIEDQQLYDLKIGVNDINTITKKIDALNDQIKAQMLQGGPANELLDMRNNYLDDLSKYLNITVQEHSNGSISVSCGSIQLVDGDGGTNTLELDTGVYPVCLKSESDGSVLDISEGSIAGTLEVLNGKGSFAALGENDFRGIPYYRNSIDTFAKTFAETFNDLNAYDGTDKPLFEGDASGITASNIKISSAWMQDAGYITTTTEVPPVEGSNDNVIRMISAMDEDINDTSVFRGTFEEYATSFISDIAVDVNFTADMEQTYESVLSAIADQRESISGVSLDEEATNLIKYQKSYAAAARLMTTLDEMLNVLINNMGVVGR